MSSFTSAKKREIRHFHVVVVQRRQRNVQKSVMHLQSCWFANLLLLFCRSRCRWRRCRRRRCLSSLFFDGNTLSYIRSRHSTTVSSSVNTLQILSELSRVLLDRQKCINSDRRFRIVICSAIFRQLESFRNYKNFNTIFSKTLTDAI